MGPYFRGGANPIPPYYKVAVCPTVKINGVLLIGVRIRPRTMQHPENFRTSSMVVVAIDFGATSTGVAYSLSDSFFDSFGPECQAGEEPTRRNLENWLSTVRSWPGLSTSEMMDSERTPSIIAYNKNNTPTWGSQVQPADKPQITVL
jgi:molecular chaperone DnaK (HSP70)